MEAAASVDGFTGASGADGGAAGAGGVSACGDIIECGFPPNGAGDIVKALRAGYPFLSAGHAERLVRAYGTRASSVLTGARNVADLGVGFGSDLTPAEVDYLRHDEWAETAEDVLWRRSKLGLELTQVERGYVFLRDESGRPTVHRSIARSIDDQVGRQSSAVGQLHGIFVDSIDIDAAVQLDPSVSNQLRSSHINVIAGSSSQVLHEQTGAIVPEIQQEPRPT